MKKKRGHKKTYYLFPESSGVYRGNKGIHCQTVVAYTTCTPGLIVTRRLGRKDWNLTHEGMGLAVITGVKKKHAYWFAGILGALCEWDGWDSGNNDVRRVRVKEILEEMAMYNWLVSVRR